MMMEVIFQDRRLSHETRVGYDRRGHLFQVIEADMPLLEKFFYELRHLVYVVERRVDYDKDRALNHMEMDQYDAHAMKFLICYRPLHLFLGGCRIILAKELLPDFGLPTVGLAKSLGASLSKEQLLKIGEVSRFLFADDRSQICLEHMQKTERDWFDIKRLHEQKILTLMSCCMAAYLAHDLHYLIFSVYPSLLRMLQSKGIPLTVLKEELEYFGKNKVAILDCQRTLKNLEKENPFFFEFLMSLNKG
jgi:N-acyl amino acid synthase of PEP-CTERM/exosortase system